MLCASKRHGAGCLILWIMAELRRGSVRPRGRVSQIAGVAGMAGDAFSPCKHSPLRGIVVFLI